MAAMLLLVLIPTSAMSIKLRATPSFVLNAEPATTINPDSSFQMRLIAQADESLADLIEDTYTFEVSISEGLIIEGPRARTVPRDPGVACTTYVRLSFAHTQDTCRLYMWARSGRLGMPVSRYFVISADSAEYWEVEPYLSPGERGHSKRINLSDNDDPMKYCRPFSTDPRFPGALPIETQAQADSLDSLRRLSSLAPELAEWRRIAASQRPGIGPPEQMDEFSSRWADSIASARADRVWHICVDMTDSTYKAVVDSILGQGTPMGRPNLFRYRATSSEMIELEKMKTGMRYRLLDVWPGMEPQGSDYP